MKKTSRLSFPQLLVFALAFALIGVVLWRSFASPNPNLAGDLNNDNTVNLSDLSILLSDYGTTNAAADINSDGTVNILDLSILLSHYGQSYSAGSPTYASETSYAAPAFTATRTIDVYNQTDFMTAWNNIQPGDQINVHGVTFSGEVQLLGKNLVSDAEIDFDSATKFVGSTNDLLPAVWIDNDSHIRLFGGDVTSLGTGIDIYGSSYILWYGFNVHNVGAGGVFLTGADKVVDHADIKGEVSYWSQNTSLDPHQEKGTGLHGINVGDSKYGVQNSRIAIYAHDGPGGAGMEIGGSGSTDGVWNNTIYMHCVNLTMQATLQVAGNCVQVWGDNVTGNDFKYIEAENLQGRPYDANGLFSGQSLSTDTVEYGQASSTNLNPYLSTTEPSVPADMRWDSRGGTIFENVSPAP